MGVSLFWVWVWGVWGVWVVVVFVVAARAAARAARSAAQQRGQVGERACAEPRARHAPQQLARVRDARLHRRRPLHALRFCNIQVAPISLPPSWSFSLKE